MPRGDLLLTRRDVLAGGDIRPGRDVLAGGNVRPGGNVLTGGDVLTRLHLLLPGGDLLTGGDVVSLPHARRALEALPECRLVNGYGPTEGTTFTCCYPIAAAGLTGATVPIGRPIANTEVYILDRRLNPVPIGASGCGVQTSRLSSR